MSASGVVKRIRLGDEVQARCGRCKEERTHQVVALNSSGTPERVVCLTCQSAHLYRGERAATKKTGEKTARRTQVVKTLSPSAARAYSAQETYAAGDVVSHPKFGLGEVVEARAGKIDVKFGAEKRTLLHAG